MTTEFIKTSNKTSISLKIEVLEGAIIHLQAGGIDGYKQGLLNRYGIINPLKQMSFSNTDGKLILPDKLSLSIDEDLGFILKRDELPVLKTAPKHIPGTFKTNYGNRGCRIQFQTLESEKFIGFGDQFRNRKTGMLLNGLAGSLWINNQTSYVPVPFFMSSAGYGIFFNTTRKITYDFGVKSKNINNFKIDADYMDIYIVTGKNYYELLDKYTHLTGRVSLPPLYSLGTWLIAQEKINSHELLQIAYAMRQEKIPCDILGLEPGWMNEIYDLTVEKKWNEERFPFYPWAVGRQDTFINTLKNMGYHFELWLCNDYDHTWEEERHCLNITKKNTNEENLLVDADELDIVEVDEHFGHIPMRLDKITQPEEPWFEHLKKFVDEGVDFFKQDGFSQINEHPDRLYGNGLHDDEMHNINFLLYSKQMVSGLEKHTKLRGLTLAVAGWAGYQRYAGTWAGDTGGGKQSIAGLMQQSIVGNAFLTCDMDVNTLEGIHAGHLLAWSQINSWSQIRYPIYRNKLCKNALRDYGQLRMRMLYYIYALGYEALNSGKPILRPMPFEYPDLNESYKLSNQYFLGSYLLVNTFAEIVFLPKGKWFDFWTKKIHLGQDKKKSIKIPAGKGGHLLLREGGIIPLVPSQIYVGEKTLKQFDILMFPTAIKSQFTIVVDDGISLKYREQEHSSVLIECQQCNDVIYIDFEKIISGTQDYLKNIKFNIQLVTSRAVQAVESGKRHNLFTHIDQAGTTNINDIDITNQLIIRLKPEIKNERK